MYSIQPVFYLAGLHIHKRDTLLVAKEYISQLLVFQISQKKILWCPDMS